MSAGTDPTARADAEDLFEDYNLLRPLSSFIIKHEWIKDRHAHRRAQLLLSVRGMITCEVASGLWLVPPQSALWIPPGITHSVREKFWGYPMLVTASDDEALGLAARLLKGQSIGDIMVSSGDVTPIELSDPVAR
jgi:AraC-like ligand binding domain